MLKYIGFKEGLPVEFFFLDGVLLVNSTLPDKRKLEIIRMYLQV